MKSNHIISWEDFGELPVVEVTFSHSVDDMIDDGTTQRCGRVVIKHLDGDMCIWLSLGEANALANTILEAIAPYNVPELYEDCLPQWENMVGE